MPRPRERMEARITSWFKHLQESEKTERREKNRPFVTISRESGLTVRPLPTCWPNICASTNARREAPWAGVDRELILKVVEEHKLPVIFERYFVESSTPLFEDILEELFGLHPPQETLVRRMSETILHLASLGLCDPCRAGSKHHHTKAPSGVHVRLVGSFEKRVAHMMEYLNLPENQAREYVMKEDHDRRAYIKRYLQKDISAVSLYDLIINTDTVSFQDAVMIIGDMVLRTQMKHVV